MRSLRPPRARAANPPREILAAIESEIYRRGVEGFDSVGRGGQSFRMYSDPLLMFLAKRWIPEYRESNQSGTAHGVGGITINVITGIDAAPYSIGNRATPAIEVQAQIADDAQDAPATDDDQPADDTASVLAQLIAQRAANPPPLPPPIAPRLSRAEVRAANQARHRAEQAARDAARRAERDAPTSDNVQTTDNP